MAKKVAPGTPRIDPIPHSLEINEKATPPENNMHDYMTTPIETDSVTKMRSEVMEISNELQSPRNIDMKTDLSRRLVNLIARARVYQRRTKSNVMKQYIKDLEVLLVSLGRKGRLEMLETAKSINGQIESSNSGLDRLKKLVTGK